MLELLFVLLIVFWLIGWLAIPSLGAIVHILLVIALIVLIYRILQGRRVL